MSLKRFFATALYGLRHVKDSLGDELPDRSTIRFIGVPVTDNPETLETIVDMSSLPIGEGITNVSGSSPIAVDNSDPANPVVSIGAATSLAPGSMSAADKSKLDAANSVGNPNTLIMYDGAGGMCAETIYSCTGTNLTLSSDGFQPMELDGNGTGNLLLPSGLRTNYIAPLTDVAVQRALPLIWHDTKDAGADTWAVTVTNDIANLITGAANDLLIEFQLPHGATIQYIKLAVKGAGVGADPLPSNPPIYTVMRKHILTGAQTIVGTVDDPLGAGYRGAYRYNSVDCTAHPDAIDNTLYRYYIRITPENGLNALAGMEIRSALALYTIPAGTTIGNW